ncbi:MAG TPA: hypothetical protein VG322_06305 [Candidatus Acidoferrales bacterium]|nr:hypothetical protein [Candidatus Acidoferrales bacterium]
MTYKAEAKARGNGTASGVALCADLFPSTYVLGYVMPPLTEAGSVSR